MNYHQATEDGEQLIPPIGYTSDSCFQRELDFLFSRSWNFAGMADDIPNPGDYRCVQAGRYPLVIVRDNEANIRAFHNICRHRGVQFLEASGNSLKGFTCPYHEWFYRLDGRLRAVPRQDVLFPKIDKSRLGLLPASVGVFRGLVFVHPDESPDEDFAAFIADLELRVGPHHPDQMVEISGTRSEFRANWKVVVENHIDTYHLSYLHDRTAAIYDHQQYEWSATGRHGIVHRQIDKKHKDWLYKAHGLTAEECVPGVDPETYGGTGHIIFPNLGWVGMAHLLRTFHIVPVAVDRTIVETRDRVMPAAVEQVNASPVYVARSKLSEGRRLITIEDSYKHPTESGDVMFQDMWVCQQVQKGLHSPAFRVGALARKLESMITFHQRNVLDFVSYR